MTSFLKALFFKAPILAQSCQNTCELSCVAGLRTLRAELWKDLCLEETAALEAGGADPRWRVSGEKSAHSLLPETLHLASHDVAAHVPYLTLYCMSARTGLTAHSLDQSFWFCSEIFLKQVSVLALVRFWTELSAPCDEVFCPWVPWGGVCGTLVIKGWRQYFDKMWRLIYTTLYT